MFSVYIIRNTDNGKVYIGKTSRSVENRIKEHLRASRYLTHRHFSKAIRKYGPSKFVIETIRQTPNEKEANWLESLYIGLSRSHTHVFGYNDTYGGEGVSGTPETRQKIRDTKRRNPRPVTEETRAKLRLARAGKTPALGMKHTPEWKAEHSAKMSGSNHPLFGTHASAETCLKWSLARRGRTPWNKGKKGGM